MAVEEVEVIAGPSGTVSSDVSVPWIEKYRPRKLKDVVGNQETVERMQIIAQEGNMPHMMLTGPPGIGKTTSILCLAHELLGPAYKEAVLELNASDERGIDVVRNKVKMFAQKKVTLPPGKQKIILLDEADSMTPAAQQALRRIMEIYSATTRFALACNISSKIIEPIQSRCAILRYSKVTDKEMLKRLLEICQAEHVNYTPEGLEAIIFIAEGDMRQAINALQSTVSGFGLVSPANVFKVCDTPHPQKVQAIFKFCYDGNINAALDELQSLYDLGYSPLDILTTFFRVAKASAVGSESEADRLMWLKEIGFMQMRVLEGNTSLVQLAGCVAKIARLHIPPSKFEW